MLFPMVTMILPAVMAIAAGPSFIRIFQIIEDIENISSHNIFFDFSHPKNKILFFMDVLLTKYREF
jgi:hypothetical protein